MTEHNGMIQNITSEYPGNPGDLISCVCYKGGLAHTATDLARAFNWLDVAYWKLVKATTISKSSPEEEREFQRLECIKKCNGLNSSLDEPKENTYARPLTNRMKMKGAFDQYDIGIAYELDPMRWAAIKKITGAGTRNGGKPMEQDIDEAIESLIEFKKEFCK